MPELILPSYAKVNLTLDVLGQRPEDGYHYIRTVMVPISLADRVTLRTAGAISVSCSPAIDGPPESNLAFRAARLLQDVTGYKGGAEIHIDKVIPVAGGLAGGSTNAAAVLTGLNRLWGTGLDQQALIALAMRLGSDVPFFIPGRPARVEGVGEVITPLPVAPGPIWLVLATPDVAKSTGNVYRLYDALPAHRHLDARAVEQALADGDPVALARALGNVFEDVMLPRHPEIAAVRAALLEGGALGALMSGAGPTVFGLVADEAHGRALVEKVRPMARSAFLVKILDA